MSQWRPVEPTNEELAQQQYPAAPQQGQGYPSAQMLPYAPVRPPRPPQPAFNPARAVVIVLVVVALLVVLSLVLGMGMFLFAARVAVS